MPNSETKRRAQRDLAEGKSASTAAGEFVREEIHHIREGKHGARNTKQAIAIGLSEARRAGVGVKPGATASKAVKSKAAQQSRRANGPTNPKRAKASARALRKEPRGAASPSSLSRQARASAKRRRKAGGSNSPAASARRAAATRKRSSSSAAR